MSPDLVELLLDGHAAPALTLDDLLAAAATPDWTEQEAKLSPHLAVASAVA